VLVTHAFEDATALAHRIGVLDYGAVVQLAPAAELIDRPANVMVAALTGANVLHGDAVPGPSGSTVRLHGGGELASSTVAAGPVEVAVYPWELELAAPDISTLTDTVISVRPDRGGLLIRLARVTVHTQPSANGIPVVTEGSTVGLRAAPANVRLLPG
jgi:molybdate transport system ATP-binding protein